MYATLWFEEDIRGETELRAYLSTSDKLKPATHPAEFCLAATTRFHKQLILLSSICWSTASLSSDHEASII